MTGKIIKGIAGSYYVHIVHKGIYQCKAKGIFRYQNIKPLPGDNVEIKILDEDEKTGNIEKIIQRDNELIRPAVANIDQAFVVFAIKSPMPNLNLLDRFLVMMESSDIKTIICFNKIDLADESEMIQMKDIYSKAGYEVVFASTLNGHGMDIVIKLLEGKTTAFAGPSGVGKSSMLNAIMPEANSETGDISEKIKRGRHTTRHTEIFNVFDNTYVMDTPGFSSMYTCQCEKEELRFLYPEYLPFEGKCRFNGCVHVNEPGCAVKEAVDKGVIAKSRYDNYLLLFDEIKNKRKY